MQRSSEMHNKKTAVVLGGTPDHIHLIEVLKEKGFNIILIDYYENPPAKKYADTHIQESTLDKEAVLRIAEQVNARLVIATCVESALTTMTYVCEKLGLPCHISYETALSLTNKSLMKKIFLASGIHTTKYVTLTEQDSAKELAVELTFPLVVKPADTNSSKGVVKVSGGSELDQAVEAALKMSHSGQVVVEEFFEGDEFSVDVVIQNAKPTILMVSKMIKSSANPRHFTIIQNTYPATEDKKIHRLIKEEVTKIVNAYALREGPLLVQLLYSQNEVRIVEFSARIGGGSKHTFLKRMTGFDAVEYFVSVLTGESYTKKPTTFNGYGAMNYIYAQPGTIKRFDGFDTVEKDGTVDEVFFYKTKGSEITATVSSNDRPAGFLVIDESRDNLNKRIREAERRMSIVDLNDRDIQIKGLYEEV